MKEIITDVGVIGAGAWGTALASVLAVNVPTVHLWCNRVETAFSINTHHENAGYLPNLALPRSLIATHHLEDLQDCAVIVLAAPSQFIAALCGVLRSFIPPTTILVLASKGLETNKICLLSEVVEQILPHNPLAILTGASFAREVALQQPTEVVLASALSLKNISTFFQTPFFTAHHSTDRVGAQVGGIVKNVVAIACGMAAGLGAGENKKAALVTQGFAEMLALGLAMGGKRETLEGLSGLGDLLLTATSISSRNYTYGFNLGEQGNNATIAAKRSVVEGAVNAFALIKLAEKHHVEMPLCRAVARVLQGDAHMKTILT